MPRYRKKPVEVDAAGWFQEGDHPAVTMIPLGLDKRLTNNCSQCGEPFYKHGNCPTLEGKHIVCPGDWIITGIKGEQYPCKPDTFEQTYERVE